MAKETANERFAIAARLVGVEPRIQRFPQDTRTAEEAATAIGCELGQIVKSLIFTVEGSPVMVLTSGSNRASTAKLEVVFGGRISRADAAVVRDSTGFAIGGVPPFGHRTPMRTAVDQDLLQFALVWGAAGSPDTVFPIDPSVLVSVSGGTVADVAE